MSDIIKNEQELFDNLLVLIPDLTKTKDEYSTFDCTSEAIKAYIELKCRRTHYDTLLIEYSKYKRLMDEAKNYNMRPLYINSTPKGVWSFDLQNFDILWSEKENLPATTDFDNKEKVTKIIGFLPIEKGDRLFWT